MSCIQNDFGHTIVVHKSHSTLLVCNTTWSLTRNRDHTERRALGASIVV